MMREKFSTIILRAIIILFAIAGVLICVFVLLTLGIAMAENFPEYAYYRYPILIGLYAAAVCFFFALFQFWLLLNGAHRDRTLSQKNLKAIRLSAMMFSVLYFLFAMPVIILAAEADDAPGLILIGAFLDTIPIGVAALAAVLERTAGK